MIEKYYQRELSHLRDLAAEFAKAHPAVAPLLSGSSADPDVERILEGTAFLSGMVYEKLDEDFPEIVHGLIQLIFPHYLRPIPSSTLIRFTPKKSLMETVRVKAGTAIDSIESEGTRCTFTTSYDVDLHPLSVAGGGFEARGNTGRMTLNLSMAQNLPLSALKAGRLRFHLGGDYAEATRRYWLLFTRLTEVRLVPGEGGEPLSLRPSCLKPVGFAEEEALIPFPARSFPGYRVLQEYFILPEKFLFFDLTGLEGWHTRGQGSKFSVELRFDNLPGELPPLRAEHFQLYVTPALNLFPYHADPILLDHKRPEYAIRPSAQNREHYQVFNVNRVTGFVQGTVQEREYLPFEMFNPQVEATPVYSLHHRLSPLGGNAELHLSVAYPGAQETPRQETLSIDILCTNASLPETLRAGDVRLPTETSPELAEFTSIRPPTAPVQPPLGKNMLWRLLSHMYLNYLSMATADNLRSMLKLYIFTETRDRVAVLANTRRVEGIAGLTVKAAERFVKGRVARGQDITLVLDRQGFAGEGDMFLFGSVLDVFLGNYAAVNSFTRLTAEDTLRKERFAWPERLGDRPLL
ncbi:MAG: type VI secretion system baseplate subunit TssF [Desulfovibrio sp.]|nr:type VI secretion system baseplate subunit TssF [Desulfovibrio sp.]